MIRRLRKKFILIAAAVVAAAMILLTAVVNIANWFGVRSEIGKTAARLSADNAVLQRTFFASDSGHHDHGRERNEGSSGQVLSDSRYFVAVISSSGTQLTGETDAQAGTLAKQAASAKEDSGFLDEYYYRRYTSSGGTAVLFLNCSARFAGIRRLALISSAVCAGGILLSVILIAFFSGLAIAPVLENDRKQKHFITDASHELKTPLSVIRANMDVLSLDVPENEWIQSTQRQVGTMTRMVNDLVFLSRSDEGAQPVHTKLDLAQLVRETAEPFVMMKEAKGGSLDMNVPETLSVTGDTKGLERLVSILCDNAVKYSPEAEPVLLYLEAKGRFAAIGTVNVPTSPISPDKLKHLFDRFYRADEARTKGTASSGTGIGLAIAQAVALGHGGDCKASMEDGKLRIECRIRLQ